LPLSLHWIIPVDIEYRMLNRRHAERENYNIGLKVDETALLIRHSSLLQR
jgi:hypothetical protein